MGVYATADELRAEPDVADDLADATAENAIARAEDLIDSWLGPGWVVQVDGPSAGRKILQAGVMAWQWAKIKRATVRLAARLNADPTLLDEPEYDEVQGPDFRTKGPRGRGRTRLAEVIAAVRDSQLQRLSANMGADRR